MTGCVFVTFVCQHIHVSVSGGRKVTLAVICGDALNNDDYVSFPQQDLSDDGLDLSGDLRLGFWLSPGVLCVRTGRGVYVCKGVLQVWWCVGTLCAGVLKYLWCIGTLCAGVLKYLWCVGTLCAGVLKYLWVHMMCTYNVCVYNM